MKKIAISVPSGYNAREILLPLQTLLENSPEVVGVNVVTPAAEFRQQLFPTFSDKFSFSEELDTSVDVVITPTFGLDDKDVPILEAAGENGIPTLVFVASWDNVFKMDRLMKKGRSKNTSSTTGYVIPDYYAVWNQMNFDHLVATFPEFNQDKITVTGPPRFDYFSHDEKIPSKEQLLEYLGFTEDKPLIHGATTELYDFDYIWDAIFAAKKKGELPDAHLYSSIHPGGDIDKHNYSRFQVKWKYSFGRRDDDLHPNFKYLPTEEQTYLLVALFKHADVLVNQSSTVAIESAIADTPIVNVKFGKSLDFIGWNRSMVYRDFKQHYKYITDQEGSYMTSNPKQLVSSVKQALSNPAELAAGRERIAKTLLTYTDGNNSKRLLDLALKVAK